MVNFVFQDLPRKAKPADVNQQASKICTPFSWLPTIPKLVRGRRCISAGLFYIPFRCLIGIYLYLAPDGFMYYKTLIVAGIRLSSEKESLLPSPLTTVSAVQYEAFIAFCTQTILSYCTHFCPYGRVAKRLPNRENGLKYMPDRLQPLHTYYWRGFPKGRYTLYIPALSHWAAEALYNFIRVANRSYCGAS